MERGTRELSSIEEGKGRDETENRKRWEVYTGERGFSCDVKIHLRHIQEESELGVQFKKGRKRGVQDEYEISDLGSWMLVMTFNQIRKSKDRGNRQIKNERQSWNEHLEARGDQALPPNLVQKGHLGMDGVWRDEGARVCESSYCRTSLFTIKMQASSAAIMGYRTYGAGNIGEGHCQIRDYNFKVACEGYLKVPRSHWDSYIILSRSATEPIHPQREAITQKYLFENGEMCEG